MYQKGNYQNGNGDFDNEHTDFFHKLSSVIIPRKIWHRTLSA